MRTTLRKWFWIWDFDKEEKWLSEMAAKGFALVSVGFCRYEFEDCIPGEYNVRLEMLDSMPDHPESRKYIQFLEETGAEHVGSRIRWIYLRRKAECGHFDLFSDNESRIRHLGGIMHLLALLGGANLCIALGNFSIAFGVNETFSAVNAVCAGISLACAALMWFGWYRLARKRQKLQAEAQVFE